MALNTYECNYLTPLHFKGLTGLADIASAHCGPMTFSAWVNVTLDIS